MGQLNLPLTAAERAVLSQLLTTDRALGMAAVGRECGLTQAQVRFALRTVEPWLRERGTRLSRTPRVGLLVEANDARRRSLLAELTRLGPSEVALSPRERVGLILLRLLTADKPVPERVLLEELGVSRSSFFRDLEECRVWLRERGLRIESKRRRGMRAAGEEQYWRDAMIELLRSELSQGQLIALCLADGASPAQERQGSVLERAAQECARRLELPWAEQQLDLLEKLLGGVLPDRARSGLVLHLALARQRQLSGHPIDVVVHGPAAGGSCGAGGLAEAGRPLKGAGAVAGGTRGAASQAHPAEWLLASQALGQALGSVLAPAEANHLSAHLAGALAEGLLSRGGKQVPVAVAADNSRLLDERELALALTREAARYLNARLFRDEELVECLTLELAATRSPDRETAPAAGEGRANPVFGFVQRVLGPLLAARGLALTPALAVALAAHIDTALDRQGRLGARRRVWVVCGSGVATARNLVTRLNLYLPPLEILGLASAFELARQPALVAGADAVISTIPLPWLDSVPVLRVSPLLTSDDVALLRATLSLPEGRPRVEAPPRGAELLGLAELLSADTVQLAVAAANWEQVVEGAGALLLKAGAVWPSYVEAMKDMIRLYGPYVVLAPGAALLHAGPDMGGKRLRFSLVVLNEPVVFGHETNDPVSVALAFSAIDHATHVRAVGQSIALLANGAAMQDLRAARSVDAALAAVSRWGAG